jgi:hypothetical protein
VTVYRPVTHGQFTVGLVTGQQPTPAQLTARWLDIRRLTQAARLCITGHETTTRTEDDQYVTRWHVTYKGRSTPQYRRDPQ